MSKFTPRQMVPLSVDIFEEVQGEVSAQITKHTLTLIPPIPPASILHDNACGSGTVTEVVLETLNPEADGRYSILVHATDVAAQRIQVVAAKAVRYGWTDVVKPAVVPAQALTFADHTFTHSLTNFALFAIPEADKAAAHVYRTLKPGGVAVVTTWASMPHLAAVNATHEAIRDDDAMLLMRLSQRWYKASTLKQVLMQAGFSSIRMSQKDAYLQIKNVRCWVKYAWSILGQPATGWGLKDEEDWEKAISVLEERLTALDEFERVGEEGARIKMVSNIAIANK
ncbi:MAG: hypothetical protein M1812_008120 [Candelaria pacifica]|nr:MAG: hypothetical protein M1812_008120 [Candelaria pacifica]